MKITISCSCGVPRIVRLASQLDRAGYLYKLYVPHDERKFPYNLFRKILRRGKQKIDIDANKIRTNLLHAIGNELIGDYKPLVGIFSPANKFILGEIADKSIANRLDDTSDIVIAESNLALHTVRRAKELGMVSVIDRTNSHIEYQTNLLLEEYKKLGQKYVIDSRVVEKGVKEYREADYIFVLSSFVKRTFLEKKIPERKLILIPSGIDIETFRQIKKEDDVFRVIYCGGLNLKKGVHYLLEAFSGLKLENAELLLIGPVSKNMEPLLLEYRGYYKLIKWVPRHLLHKYFSQGSVFVLPSIEEGMAKVIMEAMACGLPVIATTNTGAEDIIRDGVDGFIIPIRDVEAIKEKIAHLYENRDLCIRMGQSAKERIRKNFTLEHYTDRVIQACKKILEEASAKK